MRSNILKICLLLTLTLLSAADILSAQDPLPDVINAAEQGLPYFLSKIPAGSQELYGFQKSDVLSSAALGTPYRLYTITPDMIYEYSEGRTIASLITETQRWYFPVIIDNQIRSILIVDKLCDIWKAVSLGHKFIGRELARLAAAWRTDSGFTTKLISVFEANTYLFHIPEQDRYNLTVLKVAPAPEYSSENRHLKEYSVLQQPNETIQILRSIIDRQNKF